MKKFIGITTALLLVVNAFAQEDQIKNAEKAVKKLDFAGAKAILEGISLEDDQFSTTDPELVSDYLYLRGTTFNALATESGDAADYKEAVSAFNKLVKFESGEYNYAKNIETGEYQYFASKADMDKAVAEGKCKKGKTKEIKDYHSKSILPAMQALSSAVYQKGSEAYGSQDFVNARKMFETAYHAYQNPILGVKDTTALYYAAQSGVAGQNYDEAMVLFQELLDIDYTGIQTIYEATSTANGEKFSTTNENEFNTQKKFGAIENDTVYTTENLQPSIYRTMGQMYIYKGDTFEGDSVKKMELYHKALDILKEGREKYPNDKDMLLSIGNIYLKDGNQQGFIDVMKEAIKNDPNNPTLYFNIGVISADLNMKDESKEAYLKAIEIKPDYTDAYLNLAALTLKREGEINDEISALPLKLNKAQRAKYKKLEDEKKVVYKEAIQYLEGAYKYDQTNVSLLQTMKNIYYALDMNDDFMKIKKQLDSLEQ